MDMYMRGAPRGDAYICRPTFRVQIAKSKSSKNFKFFLVKLMTASTRIAVLFPAVLEKMLERRRSPMATVWGCGRELCSRSEL